ncbi:MAG: BREX system Lon protease-like protein BrxL [Planctomycetes bacterium]|nr:BREX system Lon protease-like protein BrxL [Planctomycetota bacterium]
MSSGAEPGWVDALDRKLIQHFPGRVVRKDLVQRLKVGFSIPVYVLEYLLGKYCSTTDDNQIDAGVASVKDMIRERIVRSDQNELVKARLQRYRSMKMIDLVTVTFDEKDQGGKYWARFATSGLDKVHIDERVVYTYERTLTGGVWANLELAFDETIVHGGVTRPFVLKRMQPIQIASADLGEFVEARRHFSREEWVNVLLRTIGYEPTQAALSWRRKLLYLLRLVPLVERNYNLVELGPKETGKSFVYREVSPYVVLLSGGQGSVTDLFGWKNRRDKPGLVVKYDVVAFDEIAGPNFKSANDKDMYKGYMEQGSFSRGDDKGTISAEAGIVFGGNTHGDVETLVETSHLFAPLPETIRDDDAFHDRWHAYLPGWEMPKLTPELFTSHLGFIADYIAEILHNELRPLNYTDLYERHFAFGQHVGHRDRKAVMRTVSGLVKLIHPDGEVRREELCEYLTFALEMRRRVKEQLRRINPGEFRTADLTFVDKSSGEELSVRCPEHIESSVPLEGISGRAAAVEHVSGGVSNEVFRGYELLKLLQAGGMAEAWMARSRESGETVFLKRVRSRSTDKAALEREARIYEKLMRAETTRVLKVLDFLRDDDYFALVTEYADGGDLQSYVEEQHGSGVSVTEAKQIGLEIAEAVRELHGHAIVHRDLKPQNVLALHGRWKLADFGISKNLGRMMTQRTFQGYGTPGFMAPEQFDGAEAKPSADIYSFGKILVFLLTGQTDGDLVLHPTWRRLIVRCVDHDAGNRPLIGEVISELGAIAI